jgi:hypothetical protein
VLGDLQSMCLRHDLPFFFCAFVFLCFVLLLSLFLVGFISSLPQLSWDKRLSCCCVVVLMRMIYYLSRVLYSYSGLHKRHLRWITWRTQKVTWKTLRLLPKQRRATHTRLRVTPQKHQLHVQVCTISGRDVDQAIHEWKRLRQDSNPTNDTSFQLAS